MEKVFIRRIKIIEVRHLKNFSIPLSNQNKKHLIITGKNGSGKTSLLLELREFLDLSSKGGYLEKYAAYQKQLEAAINHRDHLISSSEDFSLKEVLDADANIVHIEELLRGFQGVVVEFNKPVLAANYFKNGDLIGVYFPAQRNAAFKNPTGINQISLKGFYGLDEKAGDEFIQYIVNLRADRSFAKEENDLESVQKIDDWFRRFESSLKDLFGVEALKLEFDRKNYNFIISEQGKAPYTLNQLPAGYSAILSIVTELIMRMEAHKTKSYDVQGVVLIDEIETHLHVELQKKVLPFLTTFFPKIQFIVTTHSPFVINSIENAVICDLEKRIVTEDLSGYSYDAIIESYFDSDKYSDLLKEKLAHYERLVHQDKKSKSDTEKLIEYKNYFKSIPKFVSDELAVKLQQIRLEEMSKRGN